MLIIDPSYKSILNEACHQKGAVPWMNRGAIIMQTASGQLLFNRQSLWKLQLGENNSVHGTTIVWQEPSSVGAPSEIRTDASPTIPHPLSLCPADTDAGHYCFLFITPGPFFSQITKHLTLQYMQVGVKATSSPFIYNNEKICCSKQSRPQNS